MINAFLGNRIIVLLLLPLIIAAYHFLFYFFGSETPESTLHLGFWGNFSFLSPQLVQLASAAIICLNAILINSIFNWNEFYEKNTFISSLLYVVLMSFYASFYQLDGILISHLFLIFTILQLYKLRQNEDGRKYTFNLGFFAGVAASFHPPLLAVLPILFLMIWAIRPFVFRELILTIAGFTVPLIYVWAYLYTSGQSYSLSLVPFEKALEQEKTDFYVSSSLLIISLILSVLGVNVRLQKSSIRLKKMIRIMWWFVIIGLGLGIFDILYFQQYLQFSFIMIPMGFFFPYSFLFARFKVIAIGLFYLLIVYSVLKFFL
ncbi:MAG: hypothetical protein ITF99_05745 [Chryseobacterium sp.]|nr:hypothetical protein [Chryseobacterium sp.]